MAHAKPMNKMVEEFEGVVLVEAFNNGRLPELAAAIVRAMQAAGVVDALGFVEGLLNHTVDSLTDEERVKFARELRRLAQPQ